MIYLDNGATTKLDSSVVKAMQPYYDVQFGNASSTHQLGRDAKYALEKARASIARSIHARPEEIVFTSCGTESNNLTLKGVAFANRSKGNHIITTKIEHKCVLESCHWLEGQGFSVTYLDVDKQGFISLDDLEDAITDKTLLVSVIHGNNEIGTIQDIDLIGKICKKHKVLFHTDACQSYTKVPIDVSKTSVDLMTLNAHKIHGPKGVGALFVRSGTSLTAWQHGGGHERGLRSGTENIPGVVGFAAAVEAADKKHIAYMTRLRDELIDGLLAIGNVSLNGADKDHRLCNNVNVCFHGVDGEMLGLYLDKEGLCTSQGSACSAHATKPSHVLKAIGLTDTDVHSCLRLTLSRFTTQVEVDTAIATLRKYVEKLRKPTLFSKIKRVISG